MVIVIRLSLLNQLFTDECQFLTVQCSGRWFWRCSRLYLQLGQLLVTFDTQTRNLAEEILLCQCVTTIMVFELKAIKCKELPIFMTSTCSYQQFCSPRQVSRLYRAFCEDYSSRSFSKFIFLGLHLLICKFLMIQVFSYKLSLMDFSLLSFCEINFKEMQGLSSK